MTEQVSGPQGTKIAGRHMVMAHKLTTQRQKSYESKSFELDTNASQAC